MKLSKTANTSKEDSTDRAELGSHFFGVNTQIYLTLFSVYIFVLGILFLALNHISISGNSSYRISLESIYGFGSQPSSLVMVLALSVSFPFFYILRKSKSNQRLNNFLSFFCKLFFAPLIAIALVASEFFLGNLNLLSIANGFSATFDTALLGSSWTIFFIIFLMLVCTSIVTLLNFKIKVRGLQPIRDMAMTSWMILLCGFSSFYSASLISSTPRKIFVISSVIAIFQALWIHSFASSTSCNQSKRQFSKALFVSSMVYVTLKYHLIFFLITWNPNLSAVKVDQHRLNILIIVLTFLVFILIVLKNSVTILWAFLGSLIYLCQFPASHTVVSSLDFFDGGELFGNWYDTKVLHLIPYSQIEYPRGLLINFIPAQFANYFTYGHADLYMLILPFVAFVTGAWFVTTLKSYINVSWILVLLLVIPIPNDYWEIDFINFLILISLFKLMNSKTARKLLLLCVPSLGIFCLIMTPGQGLIQNLLLALLYLFVCMDHFKMLFKSWQFWSGILLLVLELLYFYHWVFGGVRWALRDAPWNNVMFGDGWEARLLTHENFPLNFRFFAFLLVVLLTGFVFFRREMSLVRQQYQLAFIGIIYLLVISGRWYGRTDSNSLSRIGYGSLIFIMFILLPFSGYFRSFHGRRRQLGTLFVGLVLVLACSSTSFASFSYGPSVDQVLSNPSISSPLLQRGQQLKMIADISNIFGHFHKVNALNTSGALAASYYSKLPSVGGIESAYTVSNGGQSRDWLQRLKEANTNFVYGDYGSMGIGVIDGSGFAGRSPEVFSWIVSNFSPFSCGDVDFAIKTSDISQGLRSELIAAKCVFPQNANTTLNLWSAIDGTQPNLGKSLSSWAKTDFRSTYLTPTRELIPQGYLHNPITGMVSCSTEESVVMTLSPANGPWSDLTTTFNATLKSGRFTFNPSIFPITSLVKTDLNITLSSQSCKFYPY